MTEELAGMVITGHLYPAGIELSTLIKKSKISLTSKVIMPDFYALHSYPSFIQLIYKIPFIRMYLQAKL